MGFTDLAEVLEPWLDLPIAGKTYRVPAVDIETGLYAQQIVELSARVRAGDEIAAEDVGRLKLDDDQEHDFHRKMLGTAYDEMVADGVNWEYLKHASRCAFLWTVEDRDAAERYWERGGRPEAPRPAPQDRRPKKKTPAKKPGAKK